MGQWRRNERYAKGNDGFYLLKVGCFMSKLVSIKNKHIFNSNKPETSHYYVKYYDKKNKETRLVGLTHLYDISEGNKQRLSKGLIKEEKFKALYLPSGVKNKYIRKDINGKPLKYNSSIYTDVQVVSKRQTKRIVRFAKHEDE